MVRIIKKLEGDEEFQAYLLTIEMLEFEKYVPVITFIYSEAIEGLAIKIASFLSMTAQGISPDDWAVSRFEELKANNPILKEFDQYLRQNFDIKKYGIYTQALKKTYGSIFEEETEEAVGVIEEIRIIDIVRDALNWNPGILLMYPDTTNEAQYIQTVD